MLYIKKFSNAIVKTLLFAMVSLVFVTTTVAFGNAVFGVLFGALYIYEVARI
jgi:membrane associated rhomboid family serine protease